MKIEMTPTLTNAQKYSSEFGFEPGVVAEITYFDGSKAVGMFKEVADDEMHLYENYSNNSDDYPWWHQELSRIKSIRLLSGPWSVWQFAPAGAVGCNIVGDNDIFWFCSNELVNGKKWGEGSEGYMPRPWWWLEGQK